MMGPVILCLLAIMFAMEAEQPGEAGEAEEGAFTCCPLHLLWHTGKTRAEHGGVGAPQKETNGYMVLSQGFSSICASAHLPAPLYPILWTSGFHTFGPHTGGRDLGQDRGD